MEVPERFELSLPDYETGVQPGTPRDRSGAAEEIRTPDLFLTKEGLYQLSYGSEVVVRLGIEPSSGG